MEALEDIQNEHQQILSDIFRLLVDNKILTVKAFTFQTSNPIYTYNKTSHIATTTKGVLNSSIQRLLETGFLNIVENEEFFITSDDYEKLSGEELKFYF